MRLSRRCSEVTPMIQFKNPFQGVKVEYTRSHPLTKVVVIVLIIVCTLSLITLRVTSHRMKTEIDQLRSEAAQLEADIARLKQLIGNQDSVEGVEYIAENELDLVDPDTVILDPNP